MSGAMPMPPGGAPPMPAPPAPDAGQDATPPEGGDDKVLLTVCHGDQPGTYVIYTGDEPDEAEGGDMSGDDVAAMGASGDEPGGQPVASKGEALKVILDIFNQDEGAAGGAEASFTGAFGAGSQPMAGIKTKPMMGKM